MVVSQFSLKHRYLQVLITFFLVIAFFLLFHSFQNVNISKYDEVSGSRTEKKPGEYVKYVYPLPSNESYCKLSYGLPKQLTFTKEDLAGSPELGKESLHYVLYNVIQGKLNDELPAVTYATHITKDFVVYIPELLRYWEGAVSVAVYISDGDPHIILQQFLQLCYCLPEMSRLSLHLVFRKAITDTKNPYSSEIFVPPVNCDIQNLNVVNSGLTLSNNKFNKNQTHGVNNWYPINVCRNTARQAAYTEYVMVCDVELMPSYGLASRFMDMVETLRCTDPECEKRVFVVPVFEVEASEPLPRDKKQLVDLLNQEKAVYFHRMICTHCQKFPGLEQWKDSDPGDTIKPLLITKREAPYHRWEPIYIGTKKEPLYNENLSWEGFQDKMLQMLEMCLKGYKLVILDGAFLVHWPGMKKIKFKSEPWRKPFMEMNQRQYNLLLNNMLAKYGPNPHCRIK